MLCISIFIFVSKLFISIIDINYVSDFQYTALCDFFPTVSVITVKNCFKANS